MSSCTIDIPDIFADPVPIGAMQRKMVDDIITEIEGQLKRKFMSLCGGKLNLADGVALYGNSIDAAKATYETNHNKDGSVNKNPQNHGHHFENLEVAASNRESIIQQDGLTTTTTDNLFHDKQNGTLAHDNLERHATFNDQYTDNLVYDGDGIVIQRQQLKHIQDARGLLAEAYTTHEKAPDAIIVPSDAFDDHYKALDTIAREDRDPAVRQRAAIARDKLQPGKTSKADSSSPYSAFFIQTTKDAGKRVATNVGNAILYEAAALAAGGALWEIKDACAQPNSVGIWDRIKRIFMAVYEKLKESTGIRLGKEISLEIFNFILGILKSAFRSLSSFLSLLGKSAGVVWESICDYVTGKISSFSELVRVICKTFTTVGIAFVAVLLEEKLQKLGIPSIIGGVLSAALAGLAIAFANRGIDAVIFAAVNMFSPATAAKLRREKIAEICAEALPRMIAERDQFEKMVANYYKEREILFTHAFAEMRVAAACNNMPVLFRSLEAINNAYGVTLGWSSQEEFDAMMLDDSQAFVL